MGISKSSIEEIKDKVDIVDLVESYGISLRVSGRNHLGLCPFHSENSPSFNVSRQYQTYRCFGCGESGDIISFIEEQEHCSFVDAVHELGDRAGVVIEETGEKDPQWEMKKRYIEAYEKAAFFYRTQFSKLSPNHPAVEQLAERKLLLGNQWLSKFGIGYAPEGYTNLVTYLESKGFAPDEMVEFGLASKNEERGTYFDKYRDRLMWEIRDVRGNVIGFGGRKLHEEQNPKYLNTPQTVLYHKSNVLYGLDLARKSIAKEKRVYVVEGYTDVMAMHAVGIENVVASSGTAFSDGHSRIIRNLIDNMSDNKAGEFIFVFDGDSAGTKAAMRVFDIEPSIKERSYVAPMNNGDPCDIRLRDGDEQLQQDVLVRVPLTEFVLKERSKEYDLSVPEKREEYLNEASRILSTISQSSLREEYRNKVSLWTGATFYVNSNANQSSNSRRDSNNDSYRSPNADRDVFERRILSAFMRHPEEAFDTVDRWGIDAYIKNMEYNNMLFDAMSLSGAGEKLIAGDFGNPSLFVEILSNPVDPVDVPAYIERQFKVLARLNQEDRNSDLKQGFADKYRNEGMVSTADLAAAFATRRKD